MENVKIFVTSHGAYNAGLGLVVGKWFTGDTCCCEISEELIELAEKELGGQVPYGFDDWEHFVEELYITDTDSPFKIGQYATIREVNELTEQYQYAVLNYDVDFVDEVLADSMSNLEALSGGDVYYYKASNHLELGEALVEQHGILNDIPEHLQAYFDYEKFGQDSHWGSGLCQTDNYFYEVG